MERLTDDERKMVEDNMGLVFWTVNQYRRRYGAQVPKEDDEQAGVFGLARAAQTWDPDRGFRFSTYATVHIRRAIAVGRGAEHGASYRRAVRSREEWQPTLSLDRPLNHDAEVTLLDLVAERPDYVEPDEPHPLLAVLLEAMTEREKRVVLENKYDVAADLGILPQSVVRARHRAYDRLRAKFAEAS